MRGLLNYVWNHYTPGEIYVTENGWPTTEILDDEGRLDYLQVSFCNSSKKTVRKN